MSVAALRAFLDVCVLVAGASIGSFLNVVIARVPQGRSIVWPPSSCPRCGRRIAWYDNFPIVSWLVLRARCRSCGQPISARYPVVELLTMTLFYAVWLRFGFTLEALGNAAFVGALIALTFIDVDTWLLPRRITWPLLAAGLCSTLWSPSIGWADSAIGAAAGIGFLAAIALVGEKLFHKEVMGWGDVWLLGGIGAWLGWQALLPVVMLSALQGSVTGVLLLALGRGPAERERARREQPAAAGQPAAPSGDDWVPPPHAVPYGPFLALAALEVLLAREAIFSLVGKLAP